MASYRHVVRSPCIASVLYFRMPGRSTSTHRSVGGRASRHGRASRPAARLRTRSTFLVCTASRMISSYTAVRTIMAHATDVARGIDFRISTPRSPASLRANGSRKIASERSVSMARYTATHRAVSDTFSMGMTECAHARGRPHLFKCWRRDWHRRDVSVYSAVHMRQVVHRAMLPAVITLGACAREHPSPTDAFATADSAVLRAPPSLHVLALSTYDGSGQTVHPDYVAPQRPWATPSHFLAITPYPGGDSRRENPSLFTGSDGVNWTSASGSPNPLVLPSAGYLSDPDILYSPSDNQLFLYYRQSADEDLIFLIRSSDGHQWGPATQVVSGPALSILSPSVVRRSSSDWLMWTINPDSGCRGPAAHAELRRSVDGVAWTDPQVVDLNGPGGLFAWHVDVQWIHSRNEYWALFPAKTP